MLKFTHIFNFNWNLFVIIGLQLISGQQAFGSEISDVAPKGFLFPNGGGSFVADDGFTLKNAPVEIAKFALAKLKKNQVAFNFQQDQVCLVEYAAPEESQNSGTTAVPSVNENLWLAAGAGSDRIALFTIDSVYKANSAATATKIKENCGLIVFPGGDQTAMRALWENTAFSDAVTDVVNLGGGIVGKSAGAAIQGTLGYFPEARAPSGVHDLLSGKKPYRSELTPGIFSHKLTKMPLFYVETHAGDRERAARSLALLAYWSEQNEQGNVGTWPVGVVVDSDTAAFIEFDAKHNSWTAEVVGARVVEFQFFKNQSDAGVDKNGFPFYSRAKSHVLFAGQAVHLSGPLKGQILNQSHILSDKDLDTPQAKVISSKIFAEPQALYIDGSDPVFSKEAHGALAETKQDGLSIDEADYSFLTGDITFKTFDADILWITRSFDADNKHPENRLNATRYLLGLGKTAVAISLPVGMSAVQNENEVEFTYIGKIESSVFIYNNTKTTVKSVSNYVYRDLGADKKLQLGGWTNGESSLIAPGSTWSNRRL